MQDMKIYLEKIQVQIAECQMICDLATDPNKRELFGRLAAHFNVLAREIEKTMADQMLVKCLGRKIEGPFPK
jgi:hypothetical protein